ncbi:MAG: acetylglutamate kinase [Chloroflexi bacterium]|nr:acetylglutamate kinase [Chloroflexota bacterium]
MNTVLKIGGHPLQDEAFLTELAQTVHALQQPIIIVHGGGDEVSALQRDLGIEPRYHEGLRITDPASLRLMTMAIGGLINKRLVAHLLSAGVDALGISGLDRAIVRAKTHPALAGSHTGVITQVNGARIRQMLALGITPVIAPLCIGEDGLRQYNVNADHVAAAIAAALHSERLFFLTDVPGVLDEAGQLLRELDAETTATLLDEGIIHHGMVPKVRSALDALAQGASGATIGDLPAFRAHAGTTFITQSKQMEIPSP